MNFFVIILAIFIIAIVRCWTITQVPVTCLICCICCNCWGWISCKENPKEERPNLQDYKDKESTNTITCQDCNKVFSRTEVLTAHYKKEHPESF